METVSQPPPSAEVADTLAAGVMSEATPRHIDRAFSVIEGAVQMCCRLGDLEAVTALHERILDLQARAADRVCLIEAARKAEVQ